MKTKSFSQATSSILEVVDTGDTLVVKVLSNNIDGGAFEQLLSQFALMGLSTNNIERHIGTHMVTNTSEPHDTVSYEINKVK